MTKQLQLDDLKTDYLAILSTQTSTSDTDMMVFTALAELEKIPGVSYELDEYGNLYVTKGKSETYPAFVSHMDTVHMMRDTFEVKNHDGFLYAVSTDKDDFQQVGIGGDDKCGIIGCLELLHRLKYVKVAFFLDEEKGCKGSSAGRLNFFDDCRFAVQIDRKGGGDIITTGSGTELCSKEFRAHISELGKVYGYGPTTGANTDVVKLKERGLKISAVNLSAGYYNPHGKAEYIKADELLNCIDFCRALAKFKTVFPHEKPAYTTPSYPSYNRNTGSKTVYRSSDHVKKDVKCAECGEVLSQWEASKRVHDTCLKKLYDEYSSKLPTIQITDDGPVLELPGMEDDIVVIKELQQNLPCKGCLFCHTELAHTTEQARGYCEACRFCACGELFETPEEISNQVCSKCIICSRFGIGPDNKPINMCAEAGCTNDLDNEIAQAEQRCDQCRSEVELTK